MRVDRQLRRSSGQVSSFTHLPMFVFSLLCLRSTLWMGFPICHLTLTDPLTPFAAEGPSFLTLAMVEFGPSNFAASLLLRG